MSEKSKIQWTDATWSPTVGCTHVSAGCGHCYAATLASGRLKHLPEYAGLAEHGKFNGTVRPLENRLTLPLKWRKPRMIFVDSMSDLFHRAVPDDYLAQAFAVMALAEQHTFQVLTKRHGRMRSLLSSEKFRRDVATAASDRMGEPPFDPCPTFNRVFDEWPLPNVWLGVSTEDQRWANIRIPALLDTPATIRFVSAEPLLGPIDFAEWIIEPTGALDWVIVGGESGRGARPMHPDWARSIRDQCVTAGVAFHFKQWGQWSPGNVYYDNDHSVNLLLDGTEYTPDRMQDFEQIANLRRVGKKTAGRELDGRTWDEFPEVALDGTKRLVDGQE